MNYFLFLAFLFSLSSLASARYSMTETKTVDRETQTEQNIDGPPKKVKPVKAPNSKRSALKKTGDETTVMEFLSTKYKFPKEKIAYYRSLRYGYEEIVPALIVAREAQVEPGKVLKYRSEGKNWKDIAEMHSIDLKPLNVEVIEVLDPIKKALPAQAITEKPQQRRS